MSFDFTLEKYQELCRAIVQSRYTPMTVRAYLETTTLPSRLVVFRHDVDERLTNELKIAQIEGDSGITATYYFRYKRCILQPEVIAALANMGHEIGYHYDTVDKAKGDYERALDIFRSELAGLREFADVTTICMHGNPLTPWDNRDLWNKYDFRSFGILGEAYLSLRDMVYLSDTGRTWGRAHKMKDWLPAAANGEGRSYFTPKVHSTDDVINLIRTERHHCLYLSTHAGRWADDTLEWMKCSLQDRAVNIVKRALSLKKSAKRNGA